MPASFELSKIYTFDTLAPSFLGQRMVRVKLKAVVDYDTAMLMENILIKFRQLYPALPPGGSTDPASYVYYVFENSNGVKFVLCSSWIDLQSVELIASINVQISLSDCSVQDLAKLQELLNKSGFSNYTVNVQ